MSFFSKLTSLFFSDRSMQLQAEKTAVYQAVIDTFVPAFRTPNDPALAERIEALGPLLVLRASSEVIKAYLVLKAIARQPSAELSSPLAKLVEAMRTDIGVKTTRLSEEEMLVLFLGDALVRPSPKHVSPEYPPPMSIAPGS